MSNKETNMQGALHTLSEEFKKHIVPIPIELENEPFSYKDTKLRSEVRSSSIRPSFLFLIESISTSGCWIDGMLAVRRNWDAVRRRVSGTMGISMYATKPLPEKTASGVSVVSVYDLYGLDVALSFVSALCARWKENPESKWLSTYLTGSLCILNDKYYSRYMGTYVEDSTHAANLLLLELIELEEQQPKMLGSLASEQRTLPEELIARITGSPFISTSIARELRASRCQVPTLEQLASVYKNRATGLMTDGSYVMFTDVPGLDEEENHMVRIARTGRDQLEVSGLDLSLHKQLNYELDTIVAFSLKDYARWFRTKGCDVKDSVIRMLLDVKRVHATVNETNINTACAWFIQLQYDTERLTEGMELLTMEQLAAELADMIDDALENPSLWMPMKSQPWVQSTDYN